MSADTLRRAAVLMRQRAHSATASPWRDFGSDGFRYIDSGPGSNLIANGSVSNYVDAEHIASWHPAVALAVADWLDHEADQHDLDDTTRDRAMAVARAYLGESA